jgi:LPS sulfotransferase NodH
VQASYIICGTPRSGSTLLCDLLAATGKAGSPASFYRAQSIANWAKRLGVDAEPPHGRDFDRSYLAAILDAGRGGTPVFGMRLMWENTGGLIERLAPLFPGIVGDAALLERAFGTTTFIHLSRSDKVAQGVSLVRALQSGLWHRAADGSERERNEPSQEPGYDHALIRRYVEELQSHDSSWLNWFDRHGLQPLHITYEGLSADPKQTLISVLDTIGVDPTAADNIAPRTAKLADAESIAWGERYRSTAEG